MHRCFFAEQEFRLLREPVDWAAVSAVDGGVDTLCRAQELPCPWNLGLLKGGGGAAISLGGRQDPGMEGEGGCMRLGTSLVCSASIGCCNAEHGMHNAPTSGHCCALSSHSTS